MIVLTDKPMRIFPLDGLVASITGPLVSLIICYGPRVIVLAPRPLGTLDIGQRHALCCPLLDTCSFVYHATQRDARR